ncbi:MAG TPA: AtpZ/AtpI family protein [Gemmatimonadales bacterium]|nr:AtpZ/AtpI family protein [Gemmatimonadales bacterium]
MAAPGQDEGLRIAYRYAGLGMQFAGGILMFAGLGYLLDRWLHILPALTILGVIVGSVLSFLSVYRKVIADMEKKK